MAIIQKKLVYFADFQTNKGNISYKLLMKQAPKTVQSFVRLVDSGFYNGLLFFKQIEDLLIQTGCPSNDGYGSAGYFVKCETDHGESEFQLGDLGMAHCEKDKNSSQFFVIQNATRAAYLNGVHTKFASIVSGQDVISKLIENDQIKEVVIRVEEVD